MLDYYLRPAGFTYSACEPFTKHCKIIQKLRETGNLNHLCKIELDKACFAHDAIYFESKDLTNKTVSDKILKDNLKNC